MAASRLEKYGTIFLRTKGLLQTGAMKQAHKPLWFDVYERFPPNVEPRALRPIPEKQLMPIFYPEDEIRAKFYKKFSRAVVDLTSYNELSTSTELQESTFERVVDTLEAEGIALKFERKVKKFDEKRNEQVNSTTDVNNEFSDDEIVDEFKGERLKFDLKSMLSDEK